MSDTVRIRPPRLTPMLHPPVNDILIGDKFVSDHFTGVQPFHNRITQETETDCVYVSTVGDVGPLVDGDRMLIVRIQRHDGSDETNYQGRAVMYSDLIAGRVS